MNIDEKINRRAAKVANPVDKITGRPDNAYPLPGFDNYPMEYVELFSQALGLKPTPTAFGKVVVKV